MQRVRRLARRRRDRAGERAFLVEGPHAVAAALDAGATLDDLLYEPAPDHDAEVAELVERARSAGVAVAALVPGTLARVTDAVTPQAVVAVAAWCDVPIDEVVAGATAPGAGPVVVLHDVRDPGNVGTLVRTAEAAGASGVVVAGTSADVFGPKAVRSSAGAVFHVRLTVAPEPSAALESLTTAGTRVIATAADAPTRHEDADLTGPIALVLGNEAEGLPDEVLVRVDERVAIPIEGRAESLNVAAAGAVLCFEAARQRRRAAGVAPGRGNR